MGRHIVAVSGQCVFDYHGYSRWTQFRRHTWKRARQHWPGWTAELVELPQAVLVSEPLSRTYEGLWLREPRQFLHGRRHRGNRVELAAKQRHERGGEMLPREHSLERFEASQDQSVDFRRTGWSGQRRLYTGAMLPDVDPELRAW